MNKFRLPVSIRPDTAPPQITLSALKQKRPHKRPFELTYLIDSIDRLI
jgi:hypothetical protein